MAGDREPTRRPEDIGPGWGDSELPLNFLPGNPPTTQGHVNGNPSPLPVGAGFAEGAVYIRCRS